MPDCEGVFYLLKGESRAHTDMAHGNGPKLFYFRRMVNYSAACAGARMELHGTRRAAHGTRAHRTARALSASRRTPAWLGATPDTRRDLKRVPIRGPGHTPHGIYDAVLRREIDVKGAEADT